MTMRPALSVGAEIMNNGGYMKKKTTVNKKAGKQTSSEVANRASHVLRMGKELQGLKVFSHEVQQFIKNAMAVAASALGQRE